MLVPIVLPLCLSPGPLGGAAADRPTSLALAALGVHTGTMLMVIGVVSALVYRCTDLAFLKRGWINLDLVWSAALIVTGSLLLIR